MAIKQPPTINKQSMKQIAYVVLTTAILSSCQGNVPMKNRPAAGTSLPIEGTWQLISGTLTEKGNTTITDYTKNKSFIKIINATHFAFLQHDLSKGKNADSSFSSGGGHYTLKDSSYTEHLEFCSDRQWEGNDFSFTVTINNDTLVQTGIEKVESANINRLNTEKYVRLKR